MAQKGRENIPMDKTSLELAANIEEAAPAILNAVDIVNKDLIQLLRQFRAAVDDVVSFSENLDLLLNYTETDTYHRYLVGITDSIKTKLDNSKTNECGMIQQYAGILKYGF